ncbi:hypothetical protein DSO57_1015655 [Entomophthora muscae]|uniref:Uncharacterized protein n=1 Tax=Entomophthora muscae TaxID=34485 RepID=A0ACC2UEJ9_9FUNG|nr:hypothetical protein DSO57_1015655 [Entomophthora muscae]
MGELENHDGSVDAKEADKAEQLKRRTSRYQDHVSYRDIEKIKVVGKGMFGKVYKCKYKGEICALKTITSSSRMTAKERERHIYSLKLEARALSQVRVCEYVVQLIGSCVDSANQVCILMEYVPGPNLHQFMLNFHHRLSWSKKESIAWEIATGVTFIHDRNILHRDLKSDNILISLVPPSERDGSQVNISGLLKLEPNMQHVHAKIADFGICKITTDNCATNESFRGAGSPPWMAPELCMDETMLPSKQTDVYSLGWILWELAAPGGRRPYEGSNMNEIFQFKISGYVEPLPSDTPAYFQDLVTACTSSKASSRPFADQVVDTIRDAQEEEETSHSVNLTFGNIYETRLFRAAAEQAEEAEPIPISCDALASEASLREFTTPERKEALLKQLVENLHSENSTARTDLLVLFGIKGDTESMLLCGLGDCYSSGTHGFTNVPQAISYYEQSAGLGYAPAICKLGLCYRDGIGKPCDIEKAVRCFQMAADQGDSIAQCCLGECHTLGIGVLQDHAQALNYFQKAADQDNADAQMQLGKCYYNGLGTQVDTDRAHHYFHLAASKDHPEAQYILGVMAAQGISRPPNRADSYAWFLKAAHLGHPEAQNNVGSCFYFGRGASRDFTQAIEWFLKAAAQGNCSAQNNLGHCYEMGHGVAVDIHQAISWFEQAAANGHPGAMNSLANIYLAGNGVPKTPERAFQYYTKAAGLNHPRAQKNLALCYAEGVGVARDLKKAYLWYTKAAEQGNVEANMRLGKMAANGEGVAQDLSLAFYWFSRAAEAGDPAGQVAVAKCFLRGRGVDKNLDEGFTWLTKAAAQNHTAAITYLGVCYLNGHGVEKSPELAYQHFQRSSAMGSAQAQFHLADLFRKGVGVPDGVDMEQAFYYYEQAAVHHHPMALFYLGVCFHRGLGAGVDLNRSLACLTESAALGCCEANAYIDRVRAQLGSSQISTLNQTNDILRSKSSPSASNGRSKSPVAMSRHKSKSSQSSKLSEKDCCIL